MNTQDIPIPASARHMFAGRNLAPTREETPVFEDAWALALDPKTESDETLRTGAAAIMRSLGVTSLDGRLFSGKSQKALTGREYYDRAMQTLRDGYFRPSPEWEEFAAAEEAGDRKKMRALARANIKGEGIGHDVGELVDKYDQSSLAEIDKKLDAVRDAMTPEDISILDAERETDERLNEILAAEEGSWYEGGEEAFGSRPPDREKEDAMRRQAAMDERRFAAHAALYRKYHDAIEDEGRIKRYKAQLEDENLWAVVKSLDGHITDGAQRVLDMALKSGDDPTNRIVMNAFERLSTPEQRSIAGVLQALHYGRDKNFATFLGDLGRSFADTLGMVTVGAVRGAADMVRRTYMDSAEYRDMVERRTLLEDANRERMLDWGYLGDSVIGVASTIPYMAAAAVPYVGMADMILSAKDQFQSEASRNGVDVASWDFQIGSAAFATAYAFVERIQWDKAFGGISSVSRRQMYCDAFHSLNKALRVGGAVAGTMLTESGEEGIQRALEEVAEHWGLGTDQLKNAVSGFVEDFVGSLGTMAIIGGAGAVKQGVAYRHGAIGFDTAEASALNSRIEQVNSHFTGEGRDIKPLQSFGREFGRMAEDWLNAGNLGRARKRTLQRWGLTSEQADTVNASLQTLWSNIERTDAASGERSRLESAFVGGSRVLTPAEVVAKIQNGTWRGKVETDENGNQSTDITVRGVKLRMTISPNRDKPAVDVNNPAQYESIVGALNARSGRNLTVERFAGMDEKERRDLVEGLVDNGHTTFTAPDGTKIAGRVLDAIAGRMDLTDAALPQTAWHETMHGVLSILSSAAAGEKNEDGSWRVEPDPEARKLVDALVAQGYAPQSARESVDEERLSDAFQRYMTGRVSVVEADGLLDRLGRFVARTFGYGDRGGPEIKRARTAQDRLFNTAITGHIKNAMEQAGGEEAPRSEAATPGANPATTTPPPDEAEAVLRRAEEAGGDVSAVATAFRNGDPLDAERMAALAANGLTTRMAWDHGYRWNETDGEWQFDEKLARPVDERDLPQTEYMGVDGKMHQPAGPSSEGPSSGERHQITPAEDAAYLDAVQRGDAKAVEQLERKAAALAMPNTKVVGRDGLPLVVFHGTASKERFNKFKDGAIFTFHREDLAGQYTNKRRDLWVSPQQTGRVMPLFVNLENPLEIDAKRRLWNNLRVEWSEEPVSTDEILVYAKEHGHDGVIIRNVRDNMFNDDRTAGNEYIAFDSSQVKSTGATYEMRDVGWGMKGEKIASMFGPTYDDAGNVIPLSQRFNPQNEDIRYSVSPDFAQDGTVVDALPAHLREDGRAIVAERANTPAWMVDPDGTPTDLSERDWLRREAERAHDLRLGRLTPQEADELAELEALRESLDDLGEIDFRESPDYERGAKRLAELERKYGASRYSITPAEDAAYMDAVNRGDMETAQRMVREAAKELFGWTEVAYHGGTVEGKIDRTMLRSDVHGIYANSREEGARGYGDVHALFVPKTYFDFDIFKLSEHFSWDDVLSAAGRIGLESVASEIDAKFDADEEKFDAFAEELAKEAEAQGDFNGPTFGLDVDGIAMRSVPQAAFAMGTGLIDADKLLEQYHAIGYWDSEIGGETYVIDPAYAKSADPVTYDDAGNVIPLSRRFNPQNEDIRYSVSVDEAAKMMPDTAVVGEDGKPRIVFHGSGDAEFDSFDRGDVGFHFGSYNAAMMRNYMTVDHAGVIRPYFLDIRNPLRLEDDARDWSGRGLARFLLAAETTYRNGGVLGLEQKGGASINPFTSEEDTERLRSITDMGVDESNAAMREFLEGKGYDGIVYLNDVEVDPDGDSHSFIAFRNEQIVRANEDIRYSISGTTRANAESEIESWPEVAYEGSIPNASSIPSSLENWKEYGVRMVPSSLFSGGIASQYSAEGQRRVRSLMESMRTDGVQKPLIVVVDGSPDGLAYVLEGGHRLDAIKELGLREFPALVVLDEDAFAERRYQISGAVGAESLGLRSSADAEAMERSGADRETIWRETGWWRGKDGEWRVEIPDFELNADAPRMLLASGTAHLADLIPADSAILRAYPSLGNTRIDLSESLDADGRNYGFKIEVNRKRLTDLRSILAHELQHTIQDIEGFDRGSSLDSELATRERQSDRARFDSAWTEYNRLATDIKPLVAQFAQIISRGWLTGLHDATVDEEGRVSYPNLAKDEIPRINGRMIRNVSDVYKGVWKAVKNLSAHDVQRLFRGDSFADILDYVGAKELYYFALDVSNGNEFGGVGQDWLQEAKSAYDSILGDAINNLVRADEEVSAANKPILSSFDDAYNAYKARGGEAEARLVQKRLGMTTEERAARPPWEDFDVAESEQIVRGVEQSLPKIVRESPAYDGIDADTDAPRFSIATYENGGRETLEKWLASQSNGKNATLSKEDAAQILAETDFIANVARSLARKKKRFAAFSNWSEARVELDSEGRPYFGVVRTNGDYAMNIDFSTVCKKRRPMDRIFSRLVRDGILTGANVNELSGEAVAGIQRIIKAHGLEVACALCFVDAKRYRLGDVAKRFADGGTTGEGKYFPGWNSIVEAQAKGGKKWKDRVKAAKGKKDFESRCVRAIDKDPALRVRVDGAQLVSSEGMDAFARERPGIYELWSSYGGTSHAKDSHWDAPYNNDIIRPFRSRTNDNGYSFDRAKAYAIGGVRLQSFSDFVGRMFFDYAQMFAELAGKHLPLHTYTKEPNFVKIFHRTRAKINMSLVPAVVDGGIAPGLDANGEYAWADECFPPDEAFALRSLGSNVGTIAVGVSGKHIRKLLRDPRIDMVIPYHASGINPVVAAIRRIAEFFDYTSEQNTRNADGSKYTGKEHFDFYGSLARSNDPKATASEYLAWCDKRGLLPKFDKFRDEENYYKLLADFRLYDDEGNYAPQEDVRQEYPDDLGRLVEEAVAHDQGAEDTFAAEEDAIVAEIEDRILASSDSGERHSIGTDPAWDDAEGQADAAVREADSLERSSISWDGPAFSYRSFAEAFAARDMALGFDRPREQYQQLIESLGISDEVSVDDILSEASRLKSDVRAASDSIASLAGRAEERKFAKTVQSLVEGAHEVGVEVGGNARRAWEKYISQMRRMAKGRDYEDFYSDMRLDFARLLLSFSADEFDERRKPDGEEEETAPASAASEEDEEALRAFLDADEGMDGVDLDALRQRVLDRMERRMGEIRGLRERIIARLDEWRAAEEERRRKAEEREGANPPKENDEAESDFDEGGEDTEGGAKRLEDYENESVEQLPDFKEFVEGLKADGLDLSNAGEFAAAIRFYVEDWLSRETGADPKDVLKDPVNAARYRRTVVDILRSLCTQLLDPADGKASIVAERMLAEIPGDASPAEVQGRTRAIVAFVQRNAVRQSAKKLIKDLRKTIKQLAISGKRFDETEKDLGRKITGEREQYARYLYRILDWSDGRIAQEEQKLNDIISGRRTAYEAARGTDAGLDALAQTDREIHRAVERLDALRLWGGLRRKMPGEIALAAQQIKSWLETERDAHERRWAAWKESLDAEAEALVKAFSADAKDYTPDDPGVVGKLGDELTTNFRMRLERLAVGSGAEGRRAIDAVMRRIYEGSERLQNVKAVQRARFDALLARCVQGTGMTESDFLKSLDEPIPEELNRRLVTAEQPTRMTWGQALQLLGQLEQTTSYQRNIDANGRGAFDADGNEQTPHRDLIVRALQDKPQMLRLLDELRAVYDENRVALSDAFAAVTGNPILQPDPLYMPARMYLGANDSLETTVRAWNPFGPAFSPRVRNTADFDLSVSILDIFAERQRETAVALAFGVRGMELRSILARKEVQDAIARTHGKYALRKMVAQLTDIVGDGYKGASGQSDGYRGLVQAIGNFTTYTALSWNVVTMLKQMTSIPSWTAILDGGYAEIFRHICNFDRDAARELVEAPGFVARYGATGFADMIRQEMRNPQGGNLVARLARAGMTLVQIGDFVPGILVGTGVYKARKLALMGEGLSEAAARKQAATETWGLIEENQQSSRLENTPEFLRRGGFLARQLSKFATSPMMQVAHEIHTCRMWLAEKKAGKDRGEDESDEAKRWRRKFVNQIVCNHILMPAAFYAVSQLFGMALGDEPPDDDELVGDLIMQMVSGPFSRIFLVGMLADKTGEWAARIVGGKPNVSRSDGMAAQQQLAKVLTQTGRIGADIADLDWESVRDDFVKMIGQVNAPFRYATKLTQNVAGYDPAKARRERKARIKKERGGD